MIKHLIGELKEVYRALLRQDITHSNYYKTIMIRIIGEENFEELLAVFEAPNLDCVQISDSKFAEQVVLKVQFGIRPF